MPTKTRKPRKPPKTSSRKSSNSPIPALDHFVAFCRKYLTVNEGGPLIVEDFQRRMLKDYFDGRRSTVILISKKNGKTSVLGALALHHLMTTPDAEVVIAAASREQAGIMLRQIRGFIRRSPELAGMLDVTQRVITYEAKGGQIRILASDVDTVDGAIPTLVLIDELHRHKNPDVYGVLRDGLGPRQGRMVTISTAGDDHLSPLGVLRAKAYATPGMKRDGAYRYVSTADFALHEWALDMEEVRTYAPEDSEEHKLEVLKRVESANPAPWQTVPELRRRHDDPSTTKWQWARYACGVWMAGEDSAISEKEWNACGLSDYDIPRNAPGVLIGLDLAFKWDTTAFVPIWRDPEDGMAKVGKPIILTPPQDDTSLPYEDVWAVIRAMSDHWPGCRFVLDPTRGGEQFAQQIDVEIEGIDVITYSQDPLPMALAAERLSKAIAAGEIRHPENPELTSHVLAAAAAFFGGDRWKFVKQKKKKMPIDGVIALAMAHSILLDGTEPDQGGVFYIL